jgi:hypothetical protein
MPLGKPHGKNWVTMWAKRDDQRIPHIFIVHPRAHACYIKWDVLCGITEGPLPLPPLLALATILVSLLIGNNSRTGRFAFT